MVSGEIYRELGEAAWSWVLPHVGDDDGPWLPEVVPESPEDRATQRPPEDRDSLYSGIAGLAPVLAEIGQSRELSEAEQILAAGIVARLSTVAGSGVEPSLYSGLAGDVTALRILDPGSEQVGMRRLADLATPAGWDTTLEMLADSTPATDVVLGSAGIVLAAIWAGGDHADEIAAIGCEAMLQVAEVTDGGLDWHISPDWPLSSPNYSHGTAGVAAALAIAGQTLGRPEFVSAARKGAEHLLHVGSLDDDGFIIPHTLPYSTRDVEPVTYTWCHGPTGTSHVFAALAYAGVDQVSGLEVTQLRQRCFNSVMASGVPERLRPGFWDNDGRCCGTAGVGDVLLDAAQDETDPVRAEQLLRAAQKMADALVERAIRDDAGARWRFVEYRQDPPLLPPGTSWMQGAAGIGAFLMRFARVADQGLDARIVDRPDQWWAVPSRLRLVKE